MLAVTDILQLLSFFVSFYNRCVQAAPIPSVKTSCVPLQYNSYCSNKGILLDNFVFVKSDIQQENDKKLNRLQSNLDKFRALGFSLPEKCEKATNIVSCHHFYPRCDSTGDLYKAQRLCKETCQYFTYACSHGLAMLNLLPAASRYDDIIKCSNFLSRDAGQSPECYYFDERVNGKGKTKTLSAIASCIRTYLDAPFKFLNTNIIDIVVF